MNNWEFYELLLNHIPLYLGLAIFSLTVYWIILRRYFITVLDPLALSFFNSSQGFAMVLFLYSTHAITTYYFSSYVLSQLIFLLGFCILQKRRLLAHCIRVRIPRIKHENNFIKIIFYISSILFIITQIYIYVRNGIPLFMASRLELFSDGGGDGVLARIVNVTSSVALYLCFYYGYLFRSISVGQRFFLIGVSFFTFISFVLSGSRSAFLQIVFIWFCYLISNRNVIGNTLYLLKKYQRKIITCAIVVFVGLFVFGSSGGLDIGLIKLIERIVKTGDGYYMAYPDGVIENLDSRDSFLAVFKDFLGVTRLVDWSQMPGAIGVELFRFHHNVDILIGPNPRMNLFGYIYFGYWGNIFYCFILGLLLGYVRMRFYESDRMNVVSKIFWVLMYIASTGIEMDIQYVGMLIDNIYIVYTFLVISSLSITYMFNINSKKCAINMT